MPDPSDDKIVVIGNLIPRIHGAPAMMAGSRVIRSKNMNSYYGIGVAKKTGKMRRSGLAK
jgi:hypothetical protein